MVNHLPPYLDDEVFSYIIPNNIDISKITFKLYDDYYYRRYHSFCNKQEYEVAYDDKNKLIKIGNKEYDMVFLARKKYDKGNYVYYIATQTHWNECCDCDHFPYCDCRGPLVTRYHFEWEIVSYDLKTALLCLFSDRYQELYHKYNI